MIRASRFSTTPEMIRRMRPDIREQLMQRSAAARAYIDRAMANHEAQRRAELFAFMDIFHPDVPKEKVRAMADDMRDAK